MNNAHPGRSIVKKSDRSKSKTTTTSRGGNKRKSHHFPRSGDYRLYLVRSTWSSSGPPALMDSRQLTGDAVDLVPWDGGPVGVATNL